VAVATRDTVHVLRSSDGTEAAVLPGPAAGSYRTTSALAVHVDGEETLVAAGTYNESDDDDGGEQVWSGLLRLWRLSDPTTVAWVVPAFGTGVRTLDFLAHERGLRLVAGGDPYREPKASKAVARVFDVATGRVLHQSPPVPANYADAAVRGDGTVLMVIPQGAGGTGGAVVRWAPESGEPVVRSVAGQQTSGVMALATDGSALLVGSTTDLVVVSPDTLEPVGGWTNGILASVVATRRYDGGLLVLTGSWSGEVRLWDLAAVASPDTAARRPRIACATRAGGDLVAYTVDDGTGALETARLDDGAVLVRIEQVFATAMTATPDGRLLVDDSGNVRQLEPSTLARCGDDLPLHTGRINALSMAGNLLLTCGSDAAVQVSDLDSGPVCPPLIHADYKRRPLEAVRRVDVAGTPKVVALDYNAELVFWDWAEALASEPDVEDGSSSAHRSYVDAQHRGGRCFAVWESPKGTVFLRPDAAGGVEATLMPGRRSAQWPLQATPLHLLEMLGPNLLLAGDHVGMLRGWLLPERRLVAEAAFGAPLTTLLSIGDDRVLVGTDAGLALLQVDVR
jgi:WD40 repeat protein